MLRANQLWLVVAALICVSVAYAAQVAPRRTPQSRPLPSVRPSTAVRPGSVLWHKLEQPLLAADPLLSQLATTRHTRLVANTSGHPGRSLAWRTKDGLEWLVQLRPQDVGGITKLTLSLAATTALPAVESQPEGIRPRRQTPQPAFQEADQRVSQLTDIMAQLLKTMAEQHAAAARHME